jgi:hypothetical protein
MEYVCLIYGWVKTTLARASARSWCSWSVHDSVEGRIWSIVSRCPTKGITGIRKAGSLCSCVWTRHGLCFGTSSHVFSTKSLNTSLSSVFFCGCGNFSTFGHSKYRISAFALISEQWETFYTLLSLLSYSKSLYICTIIFYYLFIFLSKCKNLKRLHVGVVPCDISVCACIVQYLNQVNCIHFLKHLSVLYDKNIQCAFFQRYITNL